MATATVAFKSREDRRKQIELEEARKAGFAPAELDENGNEINPHIPDFIAKSLWYLGSEIPSLRHQRNWKNDPVFTDASYDRGATIFQAETYRKGACENCGAVSHIAKECAERPRKVGAKFTNKNIAPDEKIQSLMLSYDGKRDRWNGYDFSTYHRFTEFYDAKDDARKKYLKDEKLKKLEEKNNNQEGNQCRNFDLGGNQCRNTGQALEFKQASILSWEAFDMRQDMHMQAAPSQAEFLYKNFKVAKDKLESQTKDAIMRKYGNAATQDEIPMELLLGQSERQVEYDRAGRIIKGQEVILPNSKYEEDVHVNNHTSVWGSWWKGHRWGYKCCQQTARNSYCTGSAGMEAAENLMKANSAARREASEGSSKKVGEKRMATWGTDIREDLELNEEALANALKKEAKHKREEKDERKRKYNVKYKNNVMTQLTNI